MSKLTDLTEVTTLADGDLAMAVDVSNTTMDATGTNSKVTLANIWAYIKTKADTFYQTILVSGTSIKTVNSTSLLGSGDVAVQPTLVSGTNIKTVNGTTLLGSGDLVTPQGNVTKVGTPVDNQVGVWTGDGTLEGTTNFTFTGDILTVTNDTDVASNQVLVLQGDRATPTNNDEVYMSFKLSDSAGNQDEFGRISVRANDVTSTSEDGVIRFSIVTAGTLGYKAQMTPTNFFPETNDSMALGRTDLSFSDLFLAEGGVINWDNGDATLTQVGNMVTLAGADLTVPSIIASNTSVPATLTNTTNTASNQGLIIQSDRATPANNDEIYQSFKLSDSAGNQDEFARITTVATDVTSTSEDSKILFSYMIGGVLTAKLRLLGTVLGPDANDGLALGTATTSWSDIFLADGGVINFNNGNATLTHSAGLLTSNVPLSLGTSNALTTGNIELGNASDTTLSRSSAGVLAVEGVVVPTVSSTNTLTNKRKQPRVYSTTNNASLTPEIDTYDIFHLTAMSAATTINNHSTSTPADGELMQFRFLDNGTARALTWGTNYVAKAGVSLPTTTVLSKNLTVLFEWNANLSKWNLLSSGQEA